MVVWQWNILLPLHKSYGMLILSKDLPIGSCQRSTVIAPALVSVVSRNGSSKLSYIIMEYTELTLIR